MSENIKIPCAVKLKGLSLEQIKEIEKVFLSVDGVTDGEEVDSWALKNYVYYGIGEDDKQTIFFDWLSSFPSNGNEDGVTLYTYEEIMALAEEATKPSTMRLKEESVSDNTQVYPTVESVSIPSTKPLKGKWDDYKAGAKVRVIKYPYKTVSFPEITEIVEENWEENWQKCVTVKDTKGIPWRFFLSDKQCNLELIPEATISDTEVPYDEIPEEITQAWVEITVGVTIKGDTSYLSRDEAYKLYKDLQDIFEVKVV